MEDVDALTSWAHAQGALAIGLVNPLTLALLKAPGQWGGPSPQSSPEKTPSPQPSPASGRGGEREVGQAGILSQDKNSQNQFSIPGADIAVGDGQPLGAPLSSGGPYFGFMCCKQALVRQMPGRIIGRTVDLDGNPGFTLTLQAREQHIRRAKATSNICSNQGLMVAAATIHMALLGADGLRRAAAASHANTQALAELASGIHGVKRLFSAPYFHEVVLQLPISSAAALTGMSEQGISGGFDLQPHYPQLGNAILVCATETKTGEDLQRHAAALRLALHYGNL
ncbi:MAG: hypothetical protein HY936_02475 [Nitrosomonadales bacterium]|nr:hypothetical protein [Nitrosomonadales bacterium]